MSAEAEGKSGNGSAALRPAALVALMVVSILGWAGHYVTEAALDAKEKVVRLEADLGGDLKVIRAELERAKQDVTEIRRLVERIDSRSRKREEQ